MNELAPIIFNEVKEAQKELSSSLSKCLATGQAPQHTTTTRQEC